MALPKKWTAWHISLIAFAFITEEASSFVNQFLSCRRSEVPCKCTGESSVNCSTLLNNSQPSEWYKCWVDIDQILEGLVSPAPESFHVLQSTILKINENLDEEEIEGLNDLHALSKYLVKPNYTIELYCASSGLKWRLVPRTTSDVVIYPIEWKRGEDELYHEFNTVQLSRMALELATDTFHKLSTLSELNELARQAEKRLKMSMGSDLRGKTSADACFNFALSGIQHMDSLFRTLCRVAIHELKRTGSRSSFSTKNVLHMIEKFAASDVQGQCALKLYHCAALCLESKGYKDAPLIESLKNGSFGFHSHRPLIWLWRYSSRQKKLLPLELVKSGNKQSIDWAEIFYDTSKPLVVDVGSGMGASLLNLSTLDNTANTKDLFNHDGTLQMSWAEFNYAGADLNQAMVNFGTGIISRDAAKRKGRVHFFCLSAVEFLSQIEHYPGGVALVMINFPSPYRLQSESTGNSQLPQKDLDQFMVTKKVLASINTLLSSLDQSGLFLLQTKSEDVAVHVKSECLALGTLECIQCKNSVECIDGEYAKYGERPKRVDKWLKANPSTERAEGQMYSCIQLLPESGQPETDAQCKHDKTLVHRCLFRLNS